MPKYPYKPLGVSFDRGYRNQLNQNFKDIEDDIKELGAGAQLALEAAGIAEEKANLAQEQADRAKAEADRLAGTDVAILDNKIRQTNEQLADMSLQKANKTEVNSLATGKADKTYVDRLFGETVSGSPKGVYETVAALTASFPSGNNNVYIVSADANWYYWDGTAWKAGGVYQATLLDSFPITNLILNGDFNNGLTSWSAFTANATVVNGELRMTGTGSSNTDRVQQAITTRTGNKFYLSANVKSSSNQVGIGHSTLMLKTHSGSGNFERLSAIRTDSVAPSLLDMRTTGKNEVAADKFILIDLTATFGSGKEPTVAEMDSIMAKFPNSWFEGSRNLYTLDDLYEGTAKIQNLETVATEAKAVSVEVKQTVDSLKLDTKQGLHEVLEDIENMRKTISFPKTKGLVAIRFDDQDYTVYQNAFPILKSRALPSTMAYVADKVGAYPSRQKVTEAQMIEMAENGMEIASHSWNHLTLPSTQEEINLEVVKSKYDIINYFNFHVRNFIEPGTYQDLGVKKSSFGENVLAHYNFYEGYKTSAILDTPVLERFGINHQTGDGKNYNEMKSWVDAVAGQNKSVIIMFHSIGDIIGGPVGDPASRGTTTEYFQELCDYLDLLRQQGEIEVVTDSAIMAASLGETENYFFNGDFELVRQNGFPTGYNITGSPTLSTENSKVGTKVLRVSNGNYISRFYTFYGMRSPVFRMSYWHRTPTAGISRVMISTINGKTITVTDTSSATWKKKEFVFALPLGNERVNIYLHPSSGTVDMDDVRIERIG